MLAPPQQLLPAAQPPPHQSAALRRSGRVFAARARALAAPSAGPAAGAGCAGMTGAQRSSPGAWCHTTALHGTEWNEPVLGHHGAVLQPFVLCDLPCPAH